MSAMLTAPEIIGATLYVAVLVAAAVAAGVGIARRFAAADALAYALVVVLGSLVQPLLVGLVLAGVGLFHAWSVLLLSAATGVSLVFGCPTRPRLDRPRQPWPALAIVVGLGAMLAAASLTVGFRGGLSDHVETHNYHYSAVAHFVQGGSLWSLPYQNPAFFTATAPNGSELLGAEVALATGGDQLQYGWLLPLGGLLVVLSAAALARELSQRALPGALVALAVLASPFGFFGTHSIANDILPVGGVIAAFALILIARRTDSRPLVVLAGIALGLAMGTKFTAVVPAGLVVLAAVILLRPRPTGLLTVPGIVVLAGPWLVRNAIAVSNPVYPQRVGVGDVELFPGYSGPLEQFNSTVGGFVLRFQTGAMGTWADLAKRFYGPLLLAALVGLVLGFRYAIRGRDLVLAVASALASLCLVAYAAMPTTGG
jgi:hypothetical protein